jgi:hypothetical protein
MKSESENRNKEQYYFAAHVTPSSKIRQLLADGTGKWAECPSLKNYFEKMTPAYSPPPPGLPPPGLPPPGLPPPGLFYLPLNAPKLNLEIKLHKQNFFQNIFLFPCNAKKCRSSPLNSKAVENTALLTLLACQNIHI